jgi:hypothetical protein
MGAVKSELVILRTEFVLEGRSLRLAGRTKASVPTRSFPTPSLSSYGNFFAGVLDDLVCLVG